MSRELLPLNRTPLEAALADCIVLESDPSPIATLWDANDCPTAWLPWLAWSLSVEGWEAAVTEQQQRQLISSSVEIHRKKGTPFAVVQALVSVGLDARLIDVRSRDAAPHAFDIEIDVHDRGVDESTSRQIEKLIKEYKNVRSYAASVRIALTAKGGVFIGAAAYFGDVMTVYPYVATDLLVTGFIGTTGATHTIDTLTIQGNN